MQSTNFKANIRRAHLLMEAGPVEISCSAFAHDVQPTKKWPGSPFAPPHKAKCHATLYFLGIDVSCHVQMSDSLLTLHRHSALV